MFVSGIIQFMDGARMEFLGRIISYRKSRIIVKIGRRKKIGLVDGKISVLRASPEKPIAHFAQLFPHPDA